MMNSKMSEKVGSCSKDSCNQQNIELKNSWTQLNAAKEVEIQNMAESDCRNSNISPPIETLVESIEQPTTAFKPYRYNGFQGKRIKMENEEYDTMNMPYRTKQEIEDDCEAFGRCISAQLRQMPRMQKFLAQRLISEVCFRGQIQTLQMNTTLTTQTTVFQQHQPFPAYSARSHFGRGAEYMMVHPHGIRHQTHMPVNTNSTAATIQHQSLINMQQQSDHAAGSINSIVNMNPTENIQ